MTRAIAMLGVMVLVSAMAKMAAAADAVPEKKRTTLGLYLTAQEAHEVAQKEKVLFIDVRSRAETVFLGMATDVDANIPYMDMTELSGWDEKKATIQLDVNSGFMTEFERRLAEKSLVGRNAKIILMCRSGDRSAAAANFLAKAGYTNVWSVIDGYEGDMGADGRRSVNGWKNASLPWAYTTPKTKMYLPN